MDIKKLEVKKHLFHIVNHTCPWPFFVGFNALIVTFGLVLFMHGYPKGTLMYSFGIILLLLISFFFFEDIIREATFEGQHTIIVKKELKLGVLLFIISEIMFFFCFFGDFFHFSFNTSIFLGCCRNFVNVVWFLFILVQMIYLRNYYVG
jgi:hypothetical protein